MECERAGWHLPQLPLNWQLPDKARTCGCGQEEEGEGGCVIFADRPAACTFEFDGQMLNRSNKGIALLKLMVISRTTILCPLALQGYHGWARMIKSWRFSVSGLSYWL